MPVAVDEGAVVVEPMRVSTAQINDYAVRVGEAFEIYDEHGWADLDLLLSRLGGEVEVRDGLESLVVLSLIHISEPTRRLRGSRMPSSA